VQGFSGEPGLRKGREWPEGRRWACVFKYAIAY